MDINKKWENNWKESEKNARRKWKGKKTIVFDCPLLFDPLFSFMCFLLFVFSFLFHFFFSLFFLSYFFFIHLFCIKILSMIFRNYFVISSLNELRSTNWLAYIYQKLTINHDKFAFHEINCSVWPLIQIFSNIKVIRKRLSIDFKIQSRNKGSVWIIFDNKYYLTWHVKWRLQTNMNFFQISWPLSFL